MTTVEKIAAAVDDAERKAKDATPGPWKLWGMSIASDRSGTGQINYDEIVAHTHDPDRGIRTFNAQHIAGWAPEVVLRHVEHTRTMLATIADLRITALVCASLAHSNSASVADLMEISLAAAWGVTE